MANWHFFGSAWRKDKSTGQGKGKRAKGYACNVRMSQIHSPIAHKYIAKSDCTEEGGGRDGVRGA